MEEIQIIELDQADPLSRGRAYGEAARDSIRDISEVYAELIGLFTGSTWSQAVDGCGAHLPAAREYAPDLMEEVEGIAQGAGRSLEDIFLLNARSEVLFAPPAGGQECTTILVLPEATAQGETIIAQNWDLFHGVKDFQVILKIPGHDGKPPLVTFTEAGQVAKIGLNGAGLGLGVNALITDNSQVGVPWIFIARRILEATTLTQALGAILSTRRACSLNYLLAKAEGEGICLETAPVEEHFLWPEEGTLVHTNHFLRPCLRFRDLGPSFDSFPSTFIRYQRACRGLNSRRDRIDPAGIKKILTDHFDYPFSVCTHQNPVDEPAKRIQTCLSIITNLTKREVEFTVGNPCQSDYRKLDFKEYLSA